MINAELNKLVIAEATNLKKYTTDRERDRLSFERLKTQDRTLCVYGQMTGGCYSDRAIALIEFSCERVFTVVEKGIYLSGKLNGSPIDTYRGHYWSPIEIFIDKKRNKNNGNNERLIAFIKGKTKTLNLK